MKIGVVLSGGGFRATVFHLGILRRLAEDNLFEKVTFLSTVSGGSLCIGLVFALSGYSWPSSKDFVEHVCSRSRDILTTSDLQFDLIKNVFRSPLNLFRTRTTILSNLMKSKWGLKLNLNELPKNPRWIINATCYETGKAWRIEKKRMGDYVFGYVINPDLPVSDAIAASAGFPALIGPLVINTSKYKWVKYANSASDDLEPIIPSYRKLHLWDGGVYDNLGMEPLFKVNGEYRDDINFLIVSDASAKFKPVKYSWGYPSTRRLLDISMSQVRSLRSRSFVNYLISNPEDGCYLQIGNTGSYIANQAGKHFSEIAPGEECMTKTEVELAANMGTMIRKLSGAEFDRLFRHGHEVANYTLSAYASSKFKSVPYH